MKTKVIILTIGLALLPASAQARGYHVSHTHKVNPYKGMKHQRLVKPKRGTVLVYNP